MILHSRNGHQLSWPMRVTFLCSGLGLLSFSPLIINADNSDTEVRQRGYEAVSAAKADVKSRKDASANRRPIGATFMGNWGSKSRRLEVQPLSEFMRRLDQRGSTLELSSDELSAINRYLSEKSLRPIGPDLSDWGKRPHSYLTRETRIQTIVIEGGTVEITGDRIRIQGGKVEIKRHIPNPDPEKKLSLQDVQKFLKAEEDMQRSIEDLRKPPDKQSVKQ